MALAEWFFSSLCSVPCGHKSSQSRGCHIKLVVLSNPTENRGCISVIGPHALSFKQELEATVEQDGSWMPPLGKMLVRPAVEEVGVASDCSDESVMLPATSLLEL